MNKIKHETQEKENILSIKFKYPNLIILIILILKISSEESKYKFINLNLDSEIIIHIQGKGNQTLLNTNKNLNLNFNYRPSEIIINNHSKNITDNFIYHLEKEENIIKLIFNVTLGDCNVMFYGLKNITRIHFLKFDSSNLTEMIGTFGDCQNLTSLNLSILDTSKVINMNKLFYCC